VPAALEMKGWDVNAYDWTEMTALIWAARRGHEEVVKMLLGREDVNPDQADTAYGRTPLSWAAKNGHSGIVKMLLQREEVNPDHADTFCDRAPLLWAAENGHEGIVKMLLGRDVNPDQADTGCGRRPLVWATMDGHEGIVKMLLQREKVNPDRADTGCGRALLEICCSTHAYIPMRLGLERNTLLHSIVLKTVQRPLASYHNTDNDPAYLVRHDQTHINQQRITNTCDSGISTVSAVIYSILGWPVNYILGECAFTEDMT